MIPQDKGQIAILGGLTEHQRWVGILHCCSALLVVPRV